MKRAEWSVFRSPRFYLAAFLFLTLIGFAVIYPGINPNTPLMNLYNNKDFAVVAPLREALEAENAAAALAQVQALSASASPEVANLVALIEPLLQNGDYPRALDYVREIKRTAPSKPDHPPSRDFWLGTDAYGYDVLLKLSHALRASLLSGMLAGLCACLLAFGAGFMAGYAGRKWKSWIDIITGYYSLVPIFLLLALFVAAHQELSTWTLALAIGVVNWPWSFNGFSNRMRTVKQMSHVRMAQISGASPWRIGVREIWPYGRAHFLMSLLTQTCLALIFETMLSLSGFASLKDLTLGHMLHEALTNSVFLTGKAWQFWPPLGASALLVVSLLALRSVYSCLVSHERKEILSRG